MRRLPALALVVALAAAMGCVRAPAPPAPPERAVGRAGASHRSRAGGAGALLGDYTVVYDGRGEVRVEARYEKTGALFSVERGAEPFLSDFEVASDIPNPRFTRGPKKGRSVVAQACASGPCLIRYRYALRSAAKKLDDLDVASEEGEVLEAPPSTWLLTPDDAPGDARVRFRVKTTEKTSFVTGVFPSRDAADAWDIELGDLWTAPYSAFGPLRMIPISVTGASVTVAVAPGKLAVSDEEISSWVGNAAGAIASYFDAYPMPEVLLLLVPSRGRWVGEGKTLSGGGGAIFMRIGERAPVKALRDDWVLIHEMTHLSFPSVAREHDWAEEGLATYVEPFVRARAGLMSREDAWRSLVEGLPNGLPAAGDRGLDRTPTWGRTYWGGALFYLLADIEIRKRTQNRFGLEHALRGVLAAGGNNAHRWPLAEAFTAGDAAIGVPVLRELHKEMGTSPHPVDLDALWRDLGIRVSHGSVQFDDAAPLAAIRRAITTP